MKRLVRKEQKHDLEKLQKCENPPLARQSSRKTFLRMNTVVSTSADLVTQSCKKENKRELRSYDSSKGFRKNSPTTHSEGTQTRCWRKKILRAVRLGEKQGGGGGLIVAKVYYFRRCGGRRGLIEHSNKMVPNG